MAIPLKDRPQLSKDDLLYMMVSRYGIEETLGHYINEISKSVNMASKYYQSDNSAAAAYCIGVAKDSCDMLKTFIADKTNIEGLSTIQEKILESNKK